MSQTYHKKNEYFANSTVKNAENSYFQRGEIFIGKDTAGLPSSTEIRLMDTRGGVTVDPYAIGHLVRFGQWFKE